MKILHITPSYKPAYIYGGPTESVSRLCEGLAAHGHEVDVYTSTANGKEELDVVPGVTVNVDGVNVTYFKRITGDPSNLSPALWRQLRQTAKNYDVIHLQSWWNILIIVSAYISLSSKVKVIVSPRGMLCEYIFNSGKSFVKKLLHRVAGRKLLAQCRVHATVYAEYVECRALIPGWEGFVLPNLLSLPNIEIQPNVNDVFTIVFLSRIHPKKGLEKLFEAISLLDINLILKIGGNGEDDYVDELKRLAENLKITSKIEWLGWVNREEKFNLLQRSDLFILVSLNENFANVVVESLHMGTAVLISEDVGLSEFVREKGLGWVSTLDVENIAKTLKEAYYDKKKLMFIRKNSRGIIEHEFSPDILIGQYIDEYQK